MARIRTIKPEFFTSSDIFNLTPLSRLFYVYLWCEADREGRLKWDVDALKIRCLPKDDCDINALADELLGRELIVIYEVDGKEYAEIPSFKHHQVINNREAESILPARVKDACTRGSGEGRKEGKGKEGKGTRVDNAPDVSAMELPPEINKTSWREWVDYRKSKRKPISEKAANEQIKFLGGFDQSTQAQIISASILNDWQGLFAPKPQATPNHEPQRRRLQPL